MRKHKINQLKAQLRKAEADLRKAVSERTAEAYRGFDLDMIPTIVDEALTEIKSNLHNYYYPYEQCAEYWVEDLLLPTSRSEDYAEVLGIDTDDPYWQGAMAGGYEFDMIEDIRREIEDKFNQYMSAHDIPGGLSLRSSDVDDTFGIAYYICNEELEAEIGELPPIPGHSLGPTK